MQEEIQIISMLYSKKGAMLTQAQSARLLKKTRARIKQMINEKKLEAIKCLGTNMVTLASIIEQIEKEEKK